MDIFITGIGAISCLGNTAEEQFESLKSEKSGISRVELVENIRKPAWGGEIKLTNNQLKELAGITSEQDIPRTTLLGLIAAKEAWKNQGSDTSLKTGLISSSTVGGMDLSENFYWDYTQSESLTKIDLVKTHDIGSGADFIANQLNISDYVTSLSTACSSAANAMALGARLIKSGILDRVLVGGMDALAKFTLNGFDSLMIYDQNIVKPFDQNRAGVNLGEAGAFLVLEGKKSLEISNNKPLAILKGWGNANDAYHQTASSPTGEGAQMAMKKALQVANLNPSEIDYINAHGTGTNNNDLSESNAIKSIFENVPPFSSTKGYTGHTLAACGALEAIFCTQMINNECLIPNIHFEVPIEEAGLIPVTKVKSETKINNILSNSFGFGGNNATVIISKA